MFEPIRNKLKDKLETINSIQEVSDYPNEEFNGFPAVVVASTRNEAEFEDTAHNKRTYVFTLFIIQENEAIGGDDTKQKAMRIVEGVVDDIMEALDKDQLLTGINLPSNETMIISFPLLTDIVSTVKYTTAEIEVNVVISFNIT